MGARAGSLALGAAWRRGLLVVALAVLAVSYVEGLLHAWGALYLVRELGFAGAPAGGLTAGFYAAFGLGPGLSAPALRRWGARGAVVALGLLGVLAAVGLLLAPVWWVTALSLAGLGVSVAGLLPGLLGWAQEVGAGVSAAGLVMTCAYGSMLLEPLAVALAGGQVSGALGWAPPALALGVLLAAGSLAGSGRPAWTWLGRLRSAD